MPQAKSIGRSDDPAPACPPHLLIDVDRIEPTEDNPRQTFDPVELEQLAESLADVTLLAPITIEPIDQLSGRYRLIVGERRWKAAKLAGWKTIACYVVRVTARQRALMIATENLERKDLNPIEQARALELLTRPTAKGGAGLSQAEVSRRFGKESSWACQVLRLLELPAKWQGRVAAGELGFRQARSLCAHVGRGDVLAAVELDLKRNAADWATADGFDRQLRQVVDRLDGLQADNPAADVDPAAGNGHAEPILSREIGRRSTPVNHVAGPHVGDREGLVAAAFDALDRLTVDELDAIGRYVNRRRRGLVGQPARA